MISSMTGYANASRELQGASLVLEMRAVNHRYLEVMFRSPDELRAIEPQCREMLAASLSRGKVEVRVSFNRPAEAQTSLQLNQELLQQLFAVSDSVRAIRSEVGELKVGEVLRWPGVLQTQEIPAATLQQIALELLRQALNDFTATRRREGEKLVALILDRAARMDELVEAVKPKIPALIQAYQEKITARLKDALVNIEDDRVRQEFALFAQKIDVDEEIGRLQTHLTELRRIVKTGGAVGKRLDFLLQELNREANTLGSKSVSSEVSQTAMELKVLIEQIREQIQNIE
ncbi:MAG: YicC/YloC family endoribonuclease [Chitinivorax sp.]